MIFILFTIFQYGAYDSLKPIFKIIFKLELKVYEDDIPILIYCTNEIFIKYFFLVFKRVLSWLYADFILVLQWGAGIGIFYYCFYPVITNKFSHANCFPKVRCVVSYLYYFFCSLLTHGDVATNPGPKKSHSYFSCCLWNVSSLIPHNILKVSLIEAYNTVHKYDFIFWFFGWIRRWWSQNQWL